MNPLLTAPGPVWYDAEVLMLESNCQQQALTVQMHSSYSCLDSYSSLYAAPARIWLNCKHTEEAAEITAGSIVLCACCSQ